MRVLPARDALHDDRRADARDQRDERSGVAPPQRRERDAVEGDAEDSGRDDREHDRGEQRHAGCGQRERDERRQHEDRSVCEIEDVEDAEDQRVSDREQRVNGPEEDAVSELLDEHELLKRDEGAVLDFEDRALGFRVA